MSVSAFAKDDPSDTSARPEAEAHSPVSLIDAPLENMPLDEDGRPMELPMMVIQIARQRSKEMQEAPDWVKELRTRKLKSYFSNDLTARSKLPKEAVTRLMKDAVKLNGYFVTNSPDVEFKTSSQRKLVSFIRDLTAKSLLSPVRDGEAKVPLAEWTVETMVVTEDLAAIARGRNFGVRALNLVVGRNLRGFSIRAASLILGASVIYLGAHFNHPRLVDDLAVGFVSGLVARAMGALDAGPLAQISNALTDWGIGPVTEELRKWAARVFARPARWMHRTLDKRKPKDDGDPDSLFNDRPKIATIDEDGTNFAEMSPEEQVANWDKVLDIWVAVAKQYGQLLRDTHHIGRGLMMMSWSDEQMAAHLVETMDSKLIALRIEAEVIMTPYKTELLVQGKNEEKLRLEKFFDHLQTLCERTWMATNISPENLADLSKKIEIDRNELLKLGVSGRDMARLLAIQAERANAVGTLVTALAVHALRTFFSAEANRNLAAEARESQRAMLRGFRLQSYMRRYLPLVQEQIRKMKFENADKSKAAPEACAAALQTATP